MHGTVSICVYVHVSEKRFILSPNRTLDTNTDVMFAFLPCEHLLSRRLCSLCQHKLNASNCSLWESKHGPTMRGEVFLFYHAKSHLFLFCLVSGHNWQCK